MKLEIITKSANETERLAEQVGKQLRGGEVVELISDLGGGKTTFVRGLARGIGSTDRVASPTFTISRQYSGTELEMYHFDFYRLQEAGLIEHELRDVIGEADIVTVVEWGEVVEHVLPDERLTVHVSISSETTRAILLSCSSKLEYLINMK